MADSDESTDKWLMVVRDWLGHIECSISMSNGRRERQNLFVRTAMEDEISS